MKTNVKIMHAFSIGGRGGNPAGVVFDADELTPEQQQAIAAKLGYPETAFVSRSKIADFKLHFFTPVKQIPHCGHATIATFTYLKKNGVIKGERSSKEIIDGTRQIIFRGENAFMEQTAPKFTFLDKETRPVLDSLGLSPEDLQPGLVPTIVNTGNSFLMVPLKSKQILAGLVLLRENVVAISERYGLIGFYPFSLIENGEVVATTRMFGPFYGIEEEAGTGMAAGPLACFLYQVMGKKQTRFLIEQGRFMKTPSPSLLHVHLTTKNGVIQTLFVGGDAYVKEEREVEI